MSRKLVNAALAAALALAFIQSAPADAQGGPQQKSQQREKIYGYGMMNDAERNEYREKMHGAQNSKERQALRDDHRKLMDERMKERGVEPGPRSGRGPNASGSGEARGPYMKGDGQRGAGPGPGPGPRGPSAPTQ